MWTWKESCMFSFDSYGSRYNWNTIIMTYCQSRLIPSNNATLKKNATCFVFSVAGLFNILTRWCTVANLKSTYRKHLDKIGLCMDVKSSISLFICRANSLNIGLWWLTDKIPYFSKLEHGTQASVFISNDPKTKESGKFVLSQLSHDILFPCLLMFSIACHTYFTMPNMSQCDTVIKKKTCLHAHLPKMMCVYMF